MNLDPALVAAPPLPAAAFLAKKDFADWLSPMLVKELRQGVRTRVFVVLFILLQVLLLVNTSLSLLVAAVQEDATMGTVFFWLMVALPVLVVLPLNGLNAVGAEIKANTLELIFLTRLTAFRIVVGKWLAIFTQALLLVCTVLPYLVLRYFIGGVNVSGDLATLGLILAVSALLSACATGISAYPTRVVRGVATLFCILVFLFGVSALNLLFVGSGALGSGLTPGEGVSLFACGIILLLVMLEVGAAKIAPPAENHSAAMRLLAWSALAVAVCQFLLGRNSTAVTTVAFLIAASLCAVAVCEEPRHILSIFRPFAARGLFGRLAGRALYPGWPSGVFFLLLTFGGFGALMSRQKIITEPERLTQFVAVAGAILLPVALIRSALPKAKQPAAIFFGVQIFCLLVTIFCATCDNALGTHFKEISAALPLCTLLMSLTSNNSETAGRLGLTALTTGVSVIALLAAMRRSWRQTAQEEKESLQLPAPTPHAPVA